MPFVDQLYSGARRLTATPYDAEDLVQETMLSGFKGFRLYREGTNLRAWLFRIMYNTWVSGYRARQSRPKEVLCDEFTDWHLSGRAMSRLVCDPPRSRRWSECQMTTSSPPSTSYLRPFGWRSISRTSRATATGRSRP